MKTLEIWLSFWRKMCFGLREARKRQNIRCEKTNTIWPLKLKIRLFRG